MIRRALLSVACAVLAAQAPDPLASVRFLEGRWAGDAGGEPGKGAGAFTFQRELDGRVLVRRSLTTFPARGDQPAIRHEDLTTVFPEAGRIKAIYWDSEGHIIHYTVQVLEDGAGAVFQSEPRPGPAFRLTYRTRGKDAMEVSFAIAAPGTDTYVTHVNGTCKRQTAAQ